MEAVLTKLSLIHWQYVQSVKLEDDVDVLLGKTFSSRDMTQELILQLFSLKFAQDCYQGGRLCQRVHNTSNLPVSVATRLAAAREQARLEALREDPAAVLGLALPAVCACVGVVPCACACPVCIQPIYVLHMFILYGL